jgi:type I restriction enzyme M protein
VILPLTVLRRLDCVLEPTKEAVLAAAPKASGPLADAMLRRAAGQQFYNTSRLDFP